MVVDIAISLALLFHAFSKVMPHSDANACRGSRCQPADARSDGQSGTYVALVIDDCDLRVQRRTNRKVILDRSTKQQGLVGFYISIE